MENGNLVEALVILIPFEIKLYESPLILSTVEGICNEDHSIQESISKRQLNQRSQT